MIAERNDPTPSGFTPPAAGPVRLSCNEVEVLCLKAARGAGLCWGLAEEAGFAARWLHARGADGPGALLARLDQSSGGVPATVPAPGGIDGGILCPIALGASLSDFATLDPSRPPAGPVGRPLLVLPFVHQMARALARPVALDWVGGRVAVTAEGAVCGALAELAATDAAAIAAVLLTAKQLPAPAPYPPAVPTTDTLDRLNAYAMLTTVPASAASRADAGSADGDND